MHGIFSEENTEVVLLINAENPFNLIDQKVMLHNMKFLCLLISTYISNRYAEPPRLFIFGGSEILSKERTTQGDPTSMETYALGILPMLNSLLDFILTNDLQTRELAFAYDLTVAGKLVDIKNLWDKLAKIGTKYGYFPKSTKSYLIVKKNCLKDAKTIFTDANVNITTDRRKHLGAVVGSDTYKVQYDENLVDDWNTQLKLLSTTAETQPQATYLAFAGGIRSKLKYSVRTIPEISNHLVSLEETLRNRFIPAVTGGHICNNTERKLLSLLTCFDGFAIPIFYEQVAVEYSNSRKLTAQLAPLIKNQIKQYTVNKTQIKITNQVIKKEKQDQCHTSLVQLRNNLSENFKR